MATDLRVDAEDRPGQLAAIGEALGNAGVNIDGFSATVDGGRGFLHLLVDNAGSARSALEGAGFTVSGERDAIVLDDVDDRPGFLGETGRKLADAGINVEAAYLATNTRIVVVVENAEAARGALGA
jgi:hypothetical protein